MRLHKEVEEMGYQQVALDDEGGACSRCAFEDENCEGIPCAGIFWIKKEDKVSVAKFKKGDVVVNRTGWVMTVLIPEPDQVGAIVVQDGTGEYLLFEEKGLRLQPQKRWVNLYKVGSKIEVGDPYPSQQQAEQGRDDTRTFAACVEVAWDTDRA